MIVRSHQLVDSFDTVIDVAERTGLLAVTPYFDLVISGQLRGGNLATERGWRLFATALLGTIGPEDVVEADDPRFQIVVFAVMGAEPLGDQLFPAVGILRLRWYTAPSLLAE